MPPGTYTATVSANNYATLTTQVTVTPDLTEVTNDFYLTNLTLVINPIFDPTITGDANAPTITNSIKAAIQVYKQDFANPMCVTILFAKITGGGDDLGMSSTYGGDIAYAGYLYALIAHATTSEDAVALSNLPSGTNNPVNGYGYVHLTTANQRALGFPGVPPNGEPDSTISLNTSNMNLDRGTTDPTKWDLISTVWHEVDEVLGLGSALDYQDQAFQVHSKNGDPSPPWAVHAEDLFRYDQNGGRSFMTDLNAASYFSLDGVNQLARFNQFEPIDQNGVASADFGDWWSAGKVYWSPPGTKPKPQVQDAFGTPGATPSLEVELTALDVIGYDLLTAQPIVQTPTHNANSFSFVWSALPGQSYQVQFTTNLTGNVWNNLGSPVTASDMTAGISDTNTSNAGRFYRVVVSSPPAVPALLIYQSQSKAMVTPYTLITNAPMTHRFLRVRQ